MIVESWQKETRNEAKLEGDCRTFADCAAVLDAGRNVDYDGPSGVLQLGPGGDPNRGVYDVFGFAVGGGEVIRSSITINV